MIAPNHETINIDVYKLGITHYNKQGNLNYRGIEIWPCTETRGFDAEIVKLHNLMKPKEGTYKDLLDLKCTNRTIMRLETRSKMIMVF